MGCRAGAAGTCRFEQKSNCPISVQPMGHVQARLTHFASRVSSAWRAMAAGVSMTWTCRASHWVMKAWGLLASKWVMLILRPSSCTHATYTQYNSMWLQNHVCHSKRKCSYVCFAVVHTTEDTWVRAWAHAHAQQAVLFRCALLM